MTLVFDKDLATEKSVTIHNFYENLGEDVVTFNAAYHCVVASDTTFQSYTGMEGMDFTTVAVISTTGVSIPQNHAYTHVSSVNISFDDSSNIYSANIILM